jgi:protein-L-isoaspartate(D-aspartate) O-methyltransferase
LENGLTGDWQFLAAPQGRANGRIMESPDGPALVLEHAAYAEGSRWEQAVRGLSPGLLLTLTGAAQTQGDCWRSIGQDRFMAGTSLSLEAFGQDPSLGPVSLGAVEHVFFAPANPDGTIQDGARMEGALRLVVPDGTDFVLASARLSGAGSVTFSGLALTAKAADAAQMNDEMVDRLKAVGTIQSPDVEQAFRRTPRHHFLPKVNRGRVYEDDAVATHFAEGTERSISSSSQPTVMALMLEQLQVEPGMRVLEIGAGTGYNAALLASLVGGGENVWTVDVDEPFCAEARAHLAAAGVQGVHVVCADGWGGWPAAAPFDRITLTVSTHDISPFWFEQLRDGGRLVLPWGAPNTQQRSIAFRKEDGRLIMESLHFCGFMELRGAYQWSPPDEETAGRSWQDWQDWLFPGQPKGDPASLVAYPLGTAPLAGEGQHSVKHRWFEYVASWA